MRIAKNNQNGVISVKSVLGLLPVCQDIANMVNGKIVARLVLYRASVLRSVWNTGR